MKKNFIPLLATALLMMLPVCGQSVVNAQNANDPYVIIVEFTFDEQNVDKAIEYLLDMQAQTLENEEGCAVYDVMLGEDDSTKIFIYEYYEDSDAFARHTASSYYKDIVEKKLKPMIKEQRVTKVVPLSKNDELYDSEV